MSKYLEGTPHQSVEAGYQENASSLFASPTKLTSTGTFESTIIAWPMAIFGLNSWEFPFAIAPPSTHKGGLPDEISMFASSNGA